MVACDKCKKLFKKRGLACHQRHCRGVDAEDQSATQRDPSSEKTNGDVETPPDNVSKRIDFISVMIKWSVYRWSPVSPVIRSSTGRELLATRDTAKEEKERRARPSPVHCQLRTSTSATCVTKCSRLFRLRSPTPSFAKGRKKINQERNVSLLRSQLTMRTSVQSAEIQALLLLALKFICFLTETIRIRMYCTPIYMDYFISFYEIQYDSLVFSLQKMMLNKYIEIFPPKMLHSGQTPLL